MGRVAPDRDLSSKSQRSRHQASIMSGDLREHLAHGRSQNFRAGQVGGCRLALNNRPPFSSVCSRRFQSFTERDSCVSLVIYV